MRVRPALAALLATLVLSLTACVPPSPPATSPGASTSATGSANTTGTQMLSSNPDPATLLSVADVEAATGMTGLKVIPPNPNTKATGRLNFATADGVLIASVSLADGAGFDESLGGRNFAREATGTGEMSYVGPSPDVSPVLTVFAAATGDHAVMMRTFVKTEGGTDTWLSIGQLQSLVGLALSRWPS